MAKSPFKMAGFSGFGNSPMKQVSGKEYPYHAKFNPKGTSKITDIANDPIHKEINKIAKGGTPRAKLLKRAKSVVSKKNALRIFKQAAKKVLGPVGIALTAVEVAKTIPKVTKATKKGLKERAKSGNINIGRKI